MGEVEFPKLTRFWCEINIKLLEKLWNDLNYLLFFMYVRENYIQVCIKVGNSKIEANQETRPLHCCMILQYGEILEIK